TRHGDTFGLYLRPVAHALDAIHDDPVLRLQAFPDDLQAVGQPAERDVAAFGDVLVVDDVNELAALVGPDRPFGDHQRLVGFADRDADAGAHAGVEDARGVGQDSAHLDRAGAGVDAVVGEIDHALVGIPLFPFQGDVDRDFQLLDRRLGVALLPALAGL